MSRLFLKRFIGSLLVALLSLQLTRLVFFLNLNSFFEAEFRQILNAFLLGIRFDAVTIAFFLTPFFALLSVAQNSKRLNQAKWIFTILMAAMNLLNCIDAEFFKFTARRSTVDLFEFAFLSDDIFNLAPNLIGTFWYLLVAFILISLLTYYLIGLVITTQELTPKSSKFIHVGFTVILLTVMSFGSLSTTPLRITDASAVNPPNLNAVALSTPFTILKTIGKPDLAFYEYSESETLQETPLTKLSDSKMFGSLSGSNVVVIIVESLAAEYAGSFNNLGVTYTPFVDSLAKHSLIFKNAFANGHRSIEGIAAVSASIPTLMYEPFTTSKFNQNKINSLASLLKTEGYYTSFMHGGNKNSMNFETFSVQANYDEFYDRDDYPFPDEHYDGIWGISDHYMFSQCVKQYSGYNQPFFSTIFTLSSHHPYTIPKEYQDIFPTGTLPIHESIGYTDQALREFFQKASKTDWYDNTIFVLTADHTSLTDQKAFQTRIGSLRIPIIYFHPNDSLLVGTDVETTQQIDIMPTILDLVGYDKPFISLGTSVFDTTRIGACVAFKHDQFQLYRNKQVLCFDGENLNFVYDAESDPMLKRNLLNRSTIDYSENLAYLKTFLQNYSFALNNDKMTAQTWSKTER